MDQYCLKTSLELEQASKRLEGFGIKAERSSQTDAAGNVVFDQLDEGVYFVQAEKSNEYDVISPTIVAVPEWNEAEGEMSYEIKVEPKHVPAEKTEKNVAPQTGLKTSARRCFEAGIMSFVAAGMIGVVEWRKVRKNEE